ncbi:MAG: type III secretion system export apparatus subunit SctU [Pseudomonadota bacterium]
MSEKDHDPTQKRLDDARSKGQVVVSRDLARVVGLSAIGELAFATEQYCRESIHVLMNLSFGRIGQPFDAAVQEMSGAAGTLLITVFCVCLLVALVSAVAGFWGQFGVLIAPETVALNFDKLNPVNGVIGLFSIKKVVETVVALIKVVLIGTIVYVLIRDELPAIVSLAGGVPSGLYVNFTQMLHSVFRILLTLCLFLAAIDFALQSYFTNKSMKMSMEDIKREYKESEGDPMVKGQRKQLARELASQPAAEQTEQADAVVVNPTHFAVALRYDTSAMQVPMVLVKGKDEVAQAMIRRARERGIPVIRHVWLARTLYATAGAKSPVPKASYEAVAHVYAVLSELRDSVHSSDQVFELESSGLPPESHLS